jgi:glucan endo-1,3-alpha-glucosidase
MTDSCDSSNLPYKAFYQRGDNWLLNNRWEQLIAMRNELTFVEMLTWCGFFTPF